MVLNAIITHALSMKYSICNVQVLPKAADLRKEAFDEFPLNIAIVLWLLSRNALITDKWLTSSLFLVPRVSLPNGMLGTFTPSERGTLRVRRGGEGGRVKLTVAYTDRNE